MGFKPIYPEINGRCRLLTCIVLFLKHVLIELSGSLYPQDEALVSEKISNFHSKFDEFDIIFIVLVF